MLIDTLSRVKNYNAQLKHYEAPYLTGDDMENIEYALERQSPKKLLEVKEKHDFSGKVLYKDGYCPVCKNELSSYYLYCGKCGQKLDWN